MDKINIKDNLATIFDRETSNAFTFLLSVIFAFATSPLVRLHAGNPYHISNITNASQGWNPETNYARVIYIIMASILMFGLMNVIRAKLGRRWLRIFIAAFAALVILLGVMVPAYTAGGIDMFHNGEQLGPSRAFGNGDKLFTNLFFLHGAGEDVLMPSAAFSLFNHGTPSIGAYVLMTALLQTLSLFAFFLLVGRIIKSNSLYFFTILWFMGTIYSGFDFPKNIAVYAFIAMCWLLFTKTLSLRKDLLLKIGIGFISSMSLLYSIDVGVIMTVTSIGIAVLLPFMALEKNTYTFKIPSRTRQTLYTPLALVGGIIIAQLIILMCIGFSGYHEFIGMSFIDIPKYQGLMFDYPLTVLNASTYLFWLPIILGGIIGYGIINLLVRESKQSKYLTREVCFAVVLYGFSLLYLRFGVGRPDTPHIASATCMLFLCGFYVVQLYIDALSTHNVRRAAYYPAAWVPAAFILLLLWPQTTFDFTQLFAAGNTTPGQIKLLAKLPSKPDSAWLDTEEQHVTTYITQHSSQKDYLFVLEPEPMYYYLTNRPNPSRFYITWFADPQKYTDELLSDLKLHPPKFIIYDGPSPYIISDGVPITARIPEVNTWILQHYKTSIKIDKTTILTR